MVTAQPCRIDHAICTWKFAAFLQHGEKRQEVFLFILLADKVKGHGGFFVRNGYIDASGGGLRPTGILS